MQRVKKILLWVLVAFAAYAIFTSPDQAADIVRTSWRDARRRRAATSATSSTPCSAAW